jgi:LacI family transcriptional regulator
MAACRVVQPIARGNGGGNGYQHDFSRWAMPHAGSRRITVEDDSIKASGLSRFIGQIFATPWGHGCSNLRIVSERDDRFHGPWNMKESVTNVTQRDLAKALGVSNATISLALRNSPVVREVLRREVQAMAEKMGYRPNPAATALSYQKQPSKHSSIHASLAWLNLWPKPGTKGVIKVRLFEDYRRGAEVCTEKFGYRLEEFSLARSSARRIEEILLARGVNGIILSPSHQCHDVDLREFQWDQFSAIRTSRLPVEPALHLVTTDQFNNTMLAFEQILAKGYKRVGFIHYGKSQGDRIWSFESGYTMIQQELPVRERLPVYRLEASDVSSREGLKKWMREQRPDAIITLHANAREVLESLGYRCPDDIALATVNTMDCDVDAGIDQNATEIGRCAVLQLLSMIRDNERGIPECMRETLIRGSWVDGATLPDRK